MAKKVLITETILRDAQQSLIATRMPIDDMLPILNKMDEVGYHSIECWGGATFDACIRFLEEDPWERLKVIKKHCKKTNLQMLFRGQNMLGYRHYADDVVEYFIKRSAYNGIDIIRVFDALNDIRNLKTSIKAAKSEGIHVQASISYTTGDLFTDEYFASYAKKLVEEGADSICIKDMAALLTPYKTESLIKCIKKAVKVPIQLHTHYTSGLASMCLLKGIESGVDAIDTALSPLALGTSHAPTESMVVALDGTQYDTGLDLSLLNEIKEYFIGLRDKYIENGLLDPKMLIADTKALQYQVPGGMLSNLLMQLKQAGKEDKLDEVLKEVPRIRQECGFPPLVTPTSQIIGTQAVLNVINRKRYESCTNEFKNLVTGRYGSTPLKIDPQFKLNIAGDMVCIDCRPADLIKPELSRLEQSISEYIEKEEDVLTYAQFPQIAPNFFKRRRAEKYGINPEYCDMENKIHPV